MIRSQKNKTLTSLAGTGSYHILRIEYTLHYNVTSLHFTYSSTPPNYKCTLIRAYQNTVNKYKRHPPYSRHLSHHSYSTNLIVHWCSPNVFAIVYYGINIFLMFYSTVTICRKSAVHFIILF
jgi:hypothetical protein